MGVGDRGHDRQSQSGATAGAALLAPAEALERAGQEGRREAGAMVEYLQLEPVARGHGTQRHLAVAVAKGVLQQIAERLLEPEPIGLDDEVRRRLDEQVSLLLGGPPGEALAHALEQLADADRLQAKR